METMSTEAIASVINVYFTNMAAMNPGGWVEIFAEDAVIYDPVGKPPINVSEDSEKFFGLLSSFFNSFEISQEQIFIAGNGAAVKWRMQVSAKNGREATAEGISVFEINDDGKIQQVLSYWNEAEMMAKLKG
ncbi:MAG: ketosteroid isomerase [Moorea sp. SIO1F2]|uniref:nuclear transport factor 2 family protein n=1 Tax=Moorena sp. SIO1F2 TaxID=2607819 RepID=UPI0013BC2354|nr:nuclear transport factor 2 family protein [Moorena sp. SIO1F2]NET85624.1 ketosteroid isomerase [Moorena sp. SIO1F2]